MTTPNLPALVSDLPTAAVARLAIHARHAEGALSPNTLRALRADGNVWSEWCAGAGVPALGADPEAVAAFVDAEASRKAPATVRRYVASVGALHRAAGLPDPTKADPVRLALRRMGRARGSRQQQAAPLDELTVARIFATTPTGPEARAIDVRDVALVLTARDLLARRAEVTGLAWADLTFAPDGSGTVLVRRSKTDQEGAGAVAYLAPATVRALLAWRALTKDTLRDSVAPKDSGADSGDAVFRTVHRTGALGGPLPAADVARIVKKLAARAGLDPAVFSGHSARVGMAQDLVAFGADLAAVMQAGRWKSPAMPARYAERLLAGRGAVAQYHAKRGR